MPPTITAYVDRPGHHRHQCFECGTVWEHANSCSQMLTEHTCPGCRQVCWERYTGVCQPEQTEA